MSASRVGYEPSSGLYYETLGAGPGPPLLMIPGGGASGGCWRVTGDGRPGWADRLAVAGRCCWITDWPGVGRSGRRSLVEIEYADVVAGYRGLLREVIGEPAVVLCHSMGGAVAWQLVANEPELVAGVVAVAAAYPGNIVARSEIVSDDGRVAVVRFADTGVLFTVDREAPYFYDDAYVHEQGIAGSTRFPESGVDLLRSGFVGLPPRMLLQRLGVLEGMPRIDDPAGFAGMRVRLVAGDRDPAHTLEIERRTVSLLREWGADAELAWLPDRGIEGNGHFLFFEANGDEVLAVVAEAIDEVAAVSA